ncbi:MAG TPA: tetratricopeptide repeat protein, partial [Candidatus Omnitrophota bacterium]|nr:tetratricopeptide repeat protein [Candidatus Omnitrophota bacterium]
MTEPREEKKGFRTHMAVCLAAVACLFGRAVFHEFSLEDVAFLNWGIIQDPRNFLRFWTTIAGPSVQTFSYTPLKTACLSLMYLGFGTQAYLYHGFALIVHGFGVAAAYQIARFFTKNGTIALCTALLFAVHPLHIGGMSSLAGMVDMLGLVLMLWALWHYLILRENDEHASFLWVYVLGCAAIFMTEAAVVFPLLLMIHEIARPNARGRRYWRTAIMMAAVALLYFIGRYFFVVTEDVVSASAGSLQAFFKGIIWAVGIGYPQELPERFLYGAIGCLAFLLSGLCVLKQEQNETYSFLKLIGGWLLVCVLPFLIMGDFPVYVAGRYLYAAAFFWCLLFSSLIFMIMQRSIDRPLAVKAGASLVMFFIVFYGALTFYNLGFVSLPVAFYERMVKLYPDDEKMRLDLARAYQAYGDPAKSFVQYSQLIKRDPKNADVYFMMERSLVAVKNYEMAQEALQQAIRIKPDFAEAYYNLAGLNAFLGRYEEGRNYALSAVRLWQQQGKILEAGQALDAFEGFVISKTQPESQETT